MSLRPPLGPTGRTGLVYHEAMLKHETGPSHPEQPARLKVCLELLKEEAVLSKMELLTPAPASPDQIEWVHPRDYIQRVKDLAAQSGYFPDTPVSPHSFEAASLAAGGAIKAVDEILTSNLENAFCLIRPPGHHATAAQGMGFCLFNNVAIGARYAQRVHKISKILIIDWDAHHGNGLQDIFYEDPSVLYISTHQSPLYPGTGNVWEIGQGRGEGFTINLPFPAGAGDNEYLRAFEQIISVISGQFKPELILIAAGFDGHFADPLTGLRLTVDGYAQMAAKAAEMAGNLCQGRILLALEGGYNLEALPFSVLATINELGRFGLHPSDPFPGPEKKLSITQASENLNLIKQIHKDFWKL